MSKTFRNLPSQMEPDEFLSTFGGIYEHSPWIAEAARANQNGNNFDTVEGLHSAMRQVVEAGTDEQKITLICAHPDLAGKAAVAGELTKDSSKEQASAGLDQCTPEKFEAFQTLNTRYREKFGFPFIVAVKGLTRSDILDAFQTRLMHDVETEFATALEQIHRIAGFRLMELAE